MNRHSALKIGIPNNNELSSFDFQLAKSGPIKAIFWKQKMTVIGPDFAVVEKMINAKWLSIFSYSFTACKIAQLRKSV